LGNDATHGVPPRNSRRATGAGQRKDALLLTGVREPADTSECGPGLGR